MELKAGFHMRVGTVAQTIENRLRWLDRKKVALNRNRFRVLPLEKYVQ